MATLRNFGQIKTKIPAIIARTAERVIVKDTIVFIKGRDRI